VGSINGLEGEVSMPSLKNALNNQPKLESWEMQIITLTLVVIYVMPVYVLGVLLITTQGGRLESGYFSWFASFTRSGAAGLGQFHQVLLPLVAALSVLSFRENGWLRLLAAFVLMSFVVVIVLEVSLNIDAILEELHKFSYKITSLTGQPPNTKKALEPTVVQFLQKMRETLILYYMTLLGLRLGGNQTTLLSSPPAVTPPPTTLHSGAVTPPPRGEG
jgi:hypothetical protein